MKLLTYLLVLCAYTACSSQPSNRMLGKWKSNEEKTLASMRSTTGIPEKARKIFENNFFGLLTIEFKESGYKSQFPGQDASTINKYYKYKILSKTDNAYTIEYEDITGKSTSTATFEGDCYYVLVSKWQFREYFCRVE